MLSNAAKVRLRGVCMSAAMLLAAAAAAAPKVEQTEVWPSAYAANAVNSLSLTRNNLTSVGRLQFAAFYGAVECAPTCRAPVLVARRRLGEDRWTVLHTPFSAEDRFSATGVRDDHNIVAIAVDPAGRMHLAFGMHNAPLAYAVSSGPVTGRRFGHGGRLAFDPLRPMVGRDETAVTYPEFLKAPDGALLFAWRNGGPGGGSGNGDQFLNRYEGGRWVRIADPMVDGVSTSMNAYLNTMAQDRAGALLASWTIRETPDWQTNHDLYFARSPDGGRIWRNMAGADLGATIDRMKADTLAKIFALPTGSSLINQTSMAVDGEGRPLIATWWAPKAAEGDHTRQYMLVWWDGVRWRTSQVSRREGPEPKDTTAARVREMGRPLVLVDRGGRVLVVTRASAPGKGLADASNRLVVWWSKDRESWTPVVLDEQVLGAWEPSYDRALWEREGKLSTLVQAAGLGAAASPMRVLTWDAAAAFRGR